jgi:hypothetical protein
MTVIHTLERPSGTRPVQAPRRSETRPTTSLVSAVPRLDAPPDDLDVPLRHRLLREPGGFEGRRLVVELAEPPDLAVLDCDHRVVRPFRARSLRQTHRRLRSRLFARPQARIPRTSRATGARTRLPPHGPGRCGHRPAADPRSTRSRDHTVAARARASPRASRPCPCLWPSRRFPRRNRRSPATSHAQYRRCNRRPREFRQSARWRRGSTDPWVFLKRSLPATPPRARLVLPP